MSCEKILTVSGIAVGSGAISAAVNVLGVWVTRTVSRIPTQGMYSAAIIAGGISGIVCGGGFLFGIVYGEDKLSKILFTQGFCSGNSMEIKKESARGRSQLIFLIASVVMAILTTTFASPKLASLAGREITRKVAAIFSLGDVVLCGLVLTCFVLE